MKKTVLVALALLFFALPFAAGADTYFVLTGKVASVKCLEIPTFAAPSMWQCTMDILPDPGLVAKVTVHCMDPGVALSCNACEVGDGVLIVGHEVKSKKMVDKIGLLVPGTY